MIRKTCWIRIPVTELSRLSPLGWASRMGNRSDLATSALFIAFTKASAFRRTCFNFR